MQSQSQSLAQPGMQPAFGDRLRQSKALIPTIAVLGVTVLALGAALLVNHSKAQNQASQASVAMAPPVVAAAPVIAAPAVQPAPWVQPPVVQPAAPAPVAQAAPRPAPAPRERVVVARAPVCVNCGTIESVTPVVRQGQVDGIGNTSIGVGAIGGAVVGGLLGNQLGKGKKGKAAATVLGAAGGGFAGNAIEKQVRKTTVYEVRVRMDDGSYRNLEQASAPTAGSRVVVEGNHTRLAPPPGASS